MTRFGERSNFRLMVRRTRSSSLVALAILPLLGACGGGPGPGQTPAPVQSILSVEQFLRAVNTSDYPQMARIFGTADGPILNQTGGGVSCFFRKIGSWIRVSDACVPWEVIETRMSLIAEILRHDDYTIRSESQVPGRSRQTMRVGVDILKSGTRYADVPFVVVRSGDGRWFVEQIQLERITSL